MDNSLAQLRQQIDTLDDELLNLLNQRMRLVKQIGACKKARQNPIYCPEREREILNRLNHRNAQIPHAPLHKEAIEAIYRQIFAVSRNLESPEHIAYLGPMGSHTHQAAEGKFGAMSHYLATESITDVFQSVQSRRAKYGVIPIESNKNGMIGETLDNLASTPLKIVAEIISPTHYAFASMATSLKEIHTLYATDKAFEQCRSLLGEHSLETATLIPLSSSAKAAQLAAKDDHAIAICSKIAANLYALPILFEHIQGNHQTRYIIVGDFKNDKSGKDKTSICATLQESHKIGSLAAFLQDIQEAPLNITKIQSHHINETCMFFIDLDGYIDDEAMQHFIKRHQKHIKWLGSYVRG